MLTCPNCRKQGYLVQEKLRPIKSKPRTLRRKYDWVKGKAVSYYYKDYPQRVRHHYWSFIHNIKRNGKWTIKKCYLGTMKCFCEHCNPEF